VRGSHHRERHGGNRRIRFSRAPPCRCMVGARRTFGSREGKDRCAPGRRITRVIGLKARRQGPLPAGTLDLATCTLTCISPGPNWIASPRRRILMILMVTLGDPSASVPNRRHCAETMRELSPLLRELVGPIPSLSTNNGFIQIAINLFLTFLCRKFISCTPLCSLSLLSCYFLVFFTPLPFSLSSPPFHFLLRLFPYDFILSVPLFLLIALPFIGLPSFPFPSIPSSVSYPHCPLRKQLMSFIAFRPHL